MLERRVNMGSYIASLNLCVTQLNYEKIIHGVNLHIKLRLKFPTIKVL